MAETAFGVTYDGPALEQGRMPVRDLAPALLSLGELFTEASTLLYPDRKPVALNIKATQEGSFVIDLILEAGSAWDQVMDMFSSEGADAIVNLKELVIVSGGGLFWLIRRMRGRRIHRREPAPTPGQVQLTLDDGTTLQIPADVLTLYGNVSVRKRARQVVEPLAREGVEELRFSSDGVVTVTVETGDVPAYELDVIQYVPLLDNEHEVVLAIASVAFQEGNKWRLTDGGDNTFWAAMEDDAFLARVESGQVRFGKGDMLRVRMRVVQTESEEGLHTERHVLDVLQHIPRFAQMRFDDPADVHAPLDDDERAAG